MERETWRDPTAAFIQLQERDGFITGMKLYALFLFLFWNPSGIPWPGVKVNPEAGKGSVKRSFRFVRNEESWLRRHARSDLIANYFGNKSRGNRIGCARVWWLWESRWRSILTEGKRFEISRVKGSAFKIALASFDLIRNNEVRDQNWRYTFLL